jgi:hypothetical protein
MLRWYGRPTYPSVINCFTNWLVGMKRYVNGTIVVMPSCCAVSAILWASATFMPSGFSHRTGNPRASAAMVISKWVSFGDATMTASISPESSIAVQSLNAAGSTIGRQRRGHGRGRVHTPQ